MSIATHNPAETNGSPGSRIVEYDATSARRDKMRQKSQGSAPAAERQHRAPAAPAHAVVAEVPQPAAVVASVPVAAIPATVIEVDAPAKPKKPAPPPEQLENFLINFVVEQTGYPPEIVELDADLEADLGIDSIKKAQLFGELREYFTFDMQANQGMTLDDFPTLRHVLAFIRKSQDDDGTLTRSVSEDAVPPVRAAVEPPAPAAVAPAPESVKPAVSPTPAAPTPAAPSAAAPSKPAPPPEQLEQFLINFVVEQTGYPPEIVELDADLEADLGIDSIKKAQLFGELREYFAFDMQANANQGMTLDDFPTLRHVLAFLQKHIDESGAAASPVPTATVEAVPPVRVDVPKPAAAPVFEPVAVSAPAAVESALAGTPVKRKANAPPPEQLEPFLINFVVEQTGYPAEIVEMDADLEADLGIDSIKKAQLFGELREYFEMEIQEGMSLEDFPTLRHVLNFLQTGSPTGQAAAVSAEAKPGAAPTPTFVVAQAVSPNGSHGKTAAAPATLSRNGETYYTRDNFMKDASMLDALRRIIIDRGIADAARVNLTAKTKLMDDVGLDSVGMLDLINAVEKEFDIKINLDDLEMESLNSSAAFASLIQRKLAGVE